MKHTNQTDHPLSVCIHGSRPRLRPNLESPNRDQIKTTGDQDRQRPRPKPRPQNQDRSRQLNTKDQNQDHRIKTQTKTDRD